MNNLAQTYINSYLEALINFKKQQLNSHLVTEVVHTLTEKVLYRRGQIIGCLQLFFVNISTKIYTRQEKFTIENNR